MGKIHEKLFDMREQGAVTASVIISLDGDDSADEFELDEEVFTKEGQMKTLSAVYGTLLLSALDDLAEQDEITSVEPNVEFSLPDDPSAPQ